ncbi:FAD-dependent monooxygenase [Vitiosangium sp. GDMCC 1.1324]|uniref:FAD-dependent monooxygenase n=1 Tax=Vitiosangium sp. (strain GDMCC 1.1324) TaxID=2138576 RepID=UPI0011B3E85F|nr:FAD-dependent monooxygenase [Vitiosangium sp. GDMCC 1.1324]
MTRPHTEHPVVIVGAGPVGLTLASFLARFEVPTVLLEAGARHRRIGSRAIFVQRDVLEILERIGCGRALADGALSIERGHTYFQERLLYTTEFPRDENDVFPPFVSVPQTRTEEVLLDQLQRQGRVDIRWGHEVQPGLIEDEQCVTLTVAGPSGVKALCASYVVGCDGAGSVIRKSMGVGYEGQSHGDKFLIVDLELHGELMSLERHFHFDPSFNPGRQVLLIPQPGGVWRIDFQVPFETELASERTSGKLDERIQKVLGDQRYEIRWVSLYQFHQLVAQKFQRGRVFIAGDAAHLMSPFGARGMNSGIADAENLAWKLWRVLSGQANAALLGTYEQERRAAALENIRITTHTMRFMVPPTSEERAARDQILRRSIESPEARALVDSGKLYTPFTYEDSPIILSAGTNAAVTPRAGAMGPDAPCRVHGNDSVTRLRALVGDGFVGLYLARDAEDARFWVRTARQEVEGKAIRLAVVVASDADAMELEGCAVIDTTGRIRAAFGPLGTLSILRPDGHIAAVWSEAKPEHLCSLADFASGADIDSL